MPIWKIDLAWIADQMGLLPCRTFCECAVGPLEISVAAGFVGKCRNLLLIEPHPKMAAAAANLLRTPVVHTAIGFEAGKKILLDNNGSSYLEGTWAPTMTRTPMNRYTVPVMTFDTIDDGEIDVLALDCEGMEWAVLSKMHSLPELLTIEIWDGNPYTKEIYEWLKDHDYRLRFSTGPTTETQLYTRANSSNP